MKVGQKVLIKMKGEECVGEITYLCKSYLGGFLVTIKGEKPTTVHRFENEIMKKLTENEANLLAEKIQGIKDFCEKESIIYKDALLK